NVSQSEFIEAGPGAFDALTSKIREGEATFKRECASCHQSNFGTNSDEAMLPFTKVGTFFSPTLWNRSVGPLRTAILRDLFWVQGRGLLHDGHLRSTDKDHVDSTEILLNPDRCDVKTELYKRLYTISDASFRIPKGSAAQERATRQQAYFVDFPGG